MYEEAVEAGIMGLGDIHRALQAADRLALGTTEATLVKKAKKAAAGLIARRRRYLGDVRDDEIAELVPTARSIYARRRFATGATGANATFEFFHKGIKDQATELGYASGSITEYHTNVQKDGVIPQAEVFVCNGISFEFNDNVGAADFREMLRCAVSWHEGQGTDTLPLGQLNEMPPVFSAAMEFGYGADDETSSDRNIRLAGPKFVFKRPIIIIRGSLARSDQGYLRLTHHAGFTVAAEFTLTARLMGVWFQKVGRR